MESAVSLPNPEFPKPIYPAGGMYQFFHDARAGNVDKIKKYENTYVSYRSNHADTNGYCPLHYACFSGNTEAVKGFIKGSCVVNQENACPLEKGTYGLNWKKTEYGTPLHCAVEVGSTDMIDVLIEAGADINSRYHKEDATPLHTAAWLNLPHVVQHLINKGANVHMLNRYGSSPVHVAAWRDSVESLTILLDNGAEIAYKNSTGSGNTPLFLAAKAGSVGCLKILLNRDQNKKDTLHTLCSGENVTALEVAIWRNHYQCIWELMRLQRSFDFIIYMKEDLNKHLQLHVMLKKFLNAAVQQLPYGAVYVDLDEIRLDEQYKTCDICSNNYQNNDVVLCLPVSCNGNDHSFHSDCFWNACWQKYYEKRKDACDKKFGSEVDAKHNAKRECPEKEILNHLELCPKEGCGKELSDADKAYRIMKIYKPTLEQ